MQAGLSDLACLLCRARSLALPEAHFGERGLEAITRGAHSCLIPSCQAEGQAVHLPDDTLLQELQPSGVEIQPTGTANLSTTAVTDQL